MVSAEVMDVEDAAQRRGDDWSAEDSGAPLDSVDPVAMAQYRAFLAAHPDRANRGYAEELDRKVPRLLGVVTSRQTLNNAGALLFTIASTRMAASRSPGSGWEAQRFRPARLRSNYPAGRSLGRTNPALDAAVVLSLSFSLIRRRTAGFGERRGRAC